MTVDDNPIGDFDALTGKRQNGLYERREPTWAEPGTEIAA